MTESWYPLAVRDDGPSNKTGYSGAGGNTREGLICHSMAGSSSVARAMLHSNQPVSWHFSLDATGLVWQHYPLEAVTWHAGSRVNNLRLIGIEHEGGPPGNLSEPLTEAQAAASVNLARWIKQTAGWPTFQRYVNLLEHREVYSTACPSGRIPWHRYTEAPVDMTVQDVGKLYIAVVSGNTDPNVDIKAATASRPGWVAWTVEVKRP